MVVVVAMTLVFNLAAGAYSGVLHSHEHEHSSDDHHRDDHAPSRATPNGDGNDWSVVDQFVHPISPDADHAHEHSAQLMLSLAEVPKWAFLRGLAAWASPRKDSAPAFDVGPSERPPRRAQSPNSNWPEPA